MSVADAILEKLEKLSPEDQRKVLEIVESLQPHPSRKNPRGMFADRAIDVSAESIDEVRREAWAGFPRDLPQEESH